MSRNIGGWMVETIMEVDSAGVSKRRHYPRRFNRLKPSDIQRRGIVIGRFKEIIFGFVT